MGVKPRRRNSGEGGCGDTTKEGKIAANRTGEWQDERITVAKGLKQVAQREADQADCSTSNSSISRPPPPMVLWTVQKSTCSLACETGFYMLEIRGLWTWCVEW